jgi:glyoxylase-like metal-dependent hydrolase (beta-lactamase superfamily II)
MTRERAIEIGEGVWRIPLLPGNRLNVFAIVDEGEVTIIDTGLRWGSPRAIVNGLHYMGYSTSAVTRIAATHAHLDHTGGLAKLRAATTASTAAHAQEASYIRTGTTPPFDRSTRAGLWCDRLLRFGFPRAAVDEVLTDGQMLPLAGGLQVVHTPGHTPGHICLLHLSSKVLIVGDALYHFNGRITWPSYATCSDFAAAKRSATLLGDLDYEVAGFGHGPEIPGDAQQHVRRFLHAHHT